MRTLELHRGATERTRWPPDHTFRIDQTPLRMAPHFDSDGYQANNDADAVKMAFDAYCFCLDHSLGRCQPADNHILAECQGAPKV